MSEGGAEKLSDGQREGKVWRAAQKVYLRDGSIWNIVKIVMVTRYTVIARVVEQEAPVLIPKHAVDRVDLKPQPQQQPGELSAI